MFLSIFVILLIFCGLATIVTFFLFVRARMALREEEPVWGEEDIARRNAEMDRKERYYRTFHFITLFSFVVLGVIILVILSGRLD